MVFALLFPELPLSRGHQLSRPVDTQEACVALASAAQMVGAKCHRFNSLGQGTYLGLGFSPRWGHILEATD